MMAMLALLLSSSSDGPIQPDCWRLILLNAPAGRYQLIERNNLPLPAETVMRLICVQTNRWPLSEKRLLLSTVSKRHRLRLPRLFDCGPLRASVVCRFLRDDPHEQHQVSHGMTSHQ